MQKDLKKIFGDQPDLDQKSIDFLTRALEKNNLPGFDYLEFKQSMRALSQMNLDPATAIKSAYATASTMGLTKQVLIQSAEHYKKVLAKEKEQFDQALNKQKEQRVKSKQEEVAVLRKKIAGYQEKIAAMQAEIEKSEKIISEADEVIQVQQQRIERTQFNFETALESILKQINDDMQTFEVHLD